MSRELLAHLPDMTDECGCSLMTGRCDKHAEMMREIHAAFYGADDRLAENIWSRSDGYGEPGYVPCQGYDWSGIRDSSCDAIEAMHAVVTNAAYNAKLEGRSS